MDTINSLKAFLTAILLCSIGILLCHLTHPSHLSYVCASILVFATSITFAFYALQRYSLHSCFSAFLIATLYNPLCFFPFPLDTEQFLHVFAIFFLSNYIHEIFLSEKTLSIEKTASLLEKNIQELEKEIGSLSFAQTSFYILKTYPRTAKLKGMHLSWRMDRLPHFEFYVLASYYPKANAKGGMSIRGLQPFQNIRIHINFNLSHSIKYSIQERGMKSSFLEKQLRNHLIHKHRYLDFKNLISP